MRLGWKLGDPVNNLTRLGTVPSWTTVKERVWKTLAYQCPERYDTTNLARMQEGLAPQRFNPQTQQFESMELHHIPAQRDGGLFDVVGVWPADHALIDPFRSIPGQ